MDETYYNGGSSFKTGSGFGKAGQGATGAFTDKMRQSRMSIGYDQSQSNMGERVTPIDGIRRGANSGVRTGHSIGKFK